MRQPRLRPHPSRGIIGIVLCEQVEDDVTIVDANRLGKNDPARTSLTEQTKILSELTLKITDCPNQK